MQGHTGADGAGHDLDEAVLAELVGHGLEHEAQRVAGLGLGGGAVVGHTLQHGGGAHVGHAVGGIDGNDGALLHADLQTFDDVGLVQLHGLEELLHQFLGGAGGGLHQLGPQLFHMIGVGRGDSALLDLVALGGVGHVVHQVDDTGAVGLGNGDGADDAAVFALQSLQGLEVITVLLAALGDGEHDRQVGVLQIVPAALGADGHALGGVLGGDSDHAGLDRAQRAQHVAHKVKVTGAVQNVDLLAGKLHGHNGGGDGDLAGDLFRVVVADGVAVGDLAEAVDGAGHVQHALDQAGLAAVAVTEDGDVANVFSFHVLLPLCQIYRH